MIQRNLPNIQVQKTGTAITSFAGLVSIIRFAQRIGVTELIDRTLAVKKRDNGYKESVYVASLVSMLLSGGTRLDDIAFLNLDRGLRKLNGGRFPAATAIGKFLGKFGKRALRNLGRINSLLTRKTIEKQKLKEVTLDADSSFIRSNKKQARKGYEGEKGYNPMFCFAAESAMTAYCVFRPGNASPGGNAMSVLRRSLRAIPGSVKKVYVRSDSAWYIASVMDYCNDRDIGFAITADKDAAVMKSIESIKEHQWQTFEDQQIAETVHAVGEKKGSPAYRLVVLRRQKQQYELFDDPYCYYAVITNRDDLSAPELIYWHRKRANAENMIKELKLGIGLENLPCGKLLANAAFCQTAVLAYNLLQAFKRIILPDGWERFTIKTLRFRFIRVAALVTNKARKLRLKLPQMYPCFNIFRKALIMANAFPRLL